MLRNFSFLDDQDRLYDYLENKNFTNKVYRYVQKSEKGTQNAYRIWMGIFNYKDTLCYATFKQAFKNINGYTNIVKYRNFQFRLLHNKIFCNNILFHWKIKNSQKCDWCPCTKQDVVHLMVNCPMVEPIWDLIQRLCEKALLDKECEFSKENIILNCVHPKAKHVINLLTLIAKFYVFKCKCKGEKPNGKILRREFTFIHDIEQYIAVKRNRINVHENKWSPMLNFLKPDCTT